MDKPCMCGHPQSSHAAEAERERNDPLVLPWCSSCSCLLYNPKPSGATLRMRELGLRVVDGGLAA